MNREGLSRVVFGLEPTSVYHKPLAEHLIEQGHLVVYATNEAIKKNRSLLDGRWDKNDTKDSANVADLVAQGKCHYYDLPETQLRDLRSLLLFRKRLKKQQHSCRVRIRNNLVAQYFPELDRFWNSTEAENLAIVRWFLDPAGIRQLTCEQFVAKVTTHSEAVRLSFQASNTILPGKAPANSLSKATSSSIIASGWPTNGIRTTSRSGGSSWPRPSDGRGLMQGGAR